MIKFKSFRIGSDIYKVEYISDLKDENGTGLWGRFVRNHQVIELNENMPSQSRHLETAIHELLHGVCDLSGSSSPWGKGKEEATVSFLSIHLTNLLLDNPKLLEELLNEAKQRRKASIR